MDVKKKRSFTFGRLAMVLLMLCLISTCCVSATFAKYVTSGTATDSARVAKWGVEISLNGTLFGTEYGSVSNPSDITVSSSNEKNVLAPGTKCDKGITINIKGSPEVAFKVEFSVESMSDVYLVKGIYGVMVEVADVNSSSDLSSLYVLDNGSYVAASSYAEGVKYYRLADKVSVEANKVYPVNWCLKNVRNVTVEEGSLEKVVAAMGTVLNNSYQPNVNIDYTCYLVWEWIMDGNDGVDTILGNIAAGANVVVLATGNVYSPITTDHYNISVGLDMAVTATQID